MQIVKAYPNTNENITLLEVLKAYKLFELDVKYTVAGGFYRDVKREKPFHDIDIFIAKEDIPKVEKCLDNKYRDNSQLKHGKLNIIAFRCFDGVKDLLSQFDFTVNMCGTTFYKKEIVESYQYVNWLHDTIEQRLCFNKNYETPKRNTVLFRMIYMLNKGFTIENGEFIEILKYCENTLKNTNFEELEELIDYE